MNLDISPLKGEGNSFVAHDLSVMFCMRSQESEFLRLQFEEDYVSKVYLPDLMVESRLLLHTVQPV